MTASGDWREGRGWVSWWQCELKIFKNGNYFSLKKCFQETSSPSEFKTSGKNNNYDTIFKMDSW